MTLIVAAANRNATVIVADRRLTGGGNVLTDEAGKLGIVLAKDSRFALAFAGLASIGVSGIGHRRPTTDRGQFRTAEWMFTTISDVAPPEHEAMPMIERFCAAATQQWRTFTALSPEQKFTEFVFSGHLRTEKRDISSFGCVITNAPDGTRRAGDEFQIMYEDNVGAYYTMLAGFDLAVRGDDVIALGEAVTEHRDPNTLLQKARLVALRAASDPRGLIGRQQISLTIPRSWGAESFGLYHSAIATTSEYHPSVIDVREEFRYVIMDPFVEVVNRPGEEFEFAVVPRVGPSKPCPCESGKRYRDCHGRRQR